MFDVFKRLKDFFDTAAEPASRHVPAPEKTENLRPSTPPDSEHDRSSHFPIPLQRRAILRTSHGNTSEDEVKLHLFENVINSKAGELACEDFVKACGEQGYKANAKDTYDLVATIYNTSRNMPVHFSRANVIATLQKGGSDFSTVAACANSWVGKPYPGVASALLRTGALAPKSFSAELFFKQGYAPHIAKDGKNVDLAAFEADITYMQHQDADKDAKERIKAQVARSGFVAQVMAGQRGETDMTMGANVYLHMVKANIERDMLVGSNFGDDEEDTIKTTQTKLFPKP